jgi:hypothetical protein
MQDQMSIHAAALPKKAKILPKKGVIFGRAG